MLKEIIHTIESNDTVKLNELRRSQVVAVYRHSKALINWDIVDEKTIEHLDWIVQEYRDKIKMRAE